MLRYFMLYLIVTCSDAPLALLADASTLPTNWRFHC